MALQIADRVKETTTTTSTGTYALAGAVDGFQSFAAVGDGNTTYYACTDGTDYEVGLGSYTASGTTLSRITILESSNSDAAVNWGAGTKEIFVTVPAEKYLVRDASGNVSLTGNLTISGTVDGRDVASDGSKLDNIEANAKNDQTITAGGGLTGGGTGDVTISHSDTSSVSSTDNSGNTFVQDLTFDTYGHVTAVGTGSVSVGDGTLTVQGTGALGGSGTFTANQSGDTTISISHDDTSSQASVNGSGRTYIQDVTLDAYGHVTGLATATETVVNTDTNTTDWRVQNSGGTQQFAVSAAEGVRFSGSGATSVSFDASTQKITISSTDTNTDTNTTYSAGSGLSLSGTTFSHSDTSSQGSANNSGATVIQDVTLDTYGHVTGLGSHTLTLANLGYTGATDANNYSFPYTVSASASNGTVVQRHSSGYIFANYFNTTPNDISTGSITKICAESGNDGYIRHASAAAVRSFLNVANGATANVGDITQVSAGGGLTGGGSSGSVTLSHSDTSSQSSVNNSGRTYIQDITLDTYGHITGITSATETVVNTDTNTTNFNVQANGGTQVNISAGEEVNFINGNATTAVVVNQTNPTVTFNHNDTSSQASVNNSGNTVIQDVTLDGYGHVTGLTSKALSIPSAANNATITLSAGTNLGGGGNFTTNQSSNETITFNLDSTIDVTEVHLGSEVQLRESTDRADLLQITSVTSTWAGLQIRNSSNEGRWSFMTDGSTAGFYDDENGDWAVQMQENGGVTLYHNNVANFTTGATYLEMARHLDMNNYDIYGCDQIFHHGDTNTYMQFHAADQWRVVVGGSERLEVKNSSPHVLVSGDLNSTSDERLKKNIKPIDNALSDICQLEGVTFDWRDTGTQGQGFIAQQVEPIIPDVVNTDQDTGMKSINYVGLIGHLVEAIKTQQTQIDDLKAEIQSMKS